VSSVRHVCEGIVLPNLGTGEFQMTILSYVGYGAGVIAILAAGTLLLPRNVRVERVASIAAAPADVIAVASSAESYQTFNPYKKADPAFKYEVFGPTSGVGSGWKFESKDGKGQAVVTKVAADRVEYAVDLGAMGKPNQTIMVVADGTGSKVTWAMDADMGYNPIGRVMGLFLDGMIGQNHANGIQLLGEALKK
jgi:Polyketide cyclase / dehydrase and lipid transport